jgi:hypothetical protein
MSKSFPDDTPVTVTEVTGALEGTVKSHPCFGLIQISRVNSMPPARCFGSELKSHTTMLLRITEGEEHYHLHSKHYYNKRQIVEVELTPTQYAEMLTSMNMGVGVPCTIKYRADVGHIPGFIDNDTLREQINKDLKADIAGVIALTKSLRKELDTTLATTNLSQSKKKALTDIVQRIDMELVSNMPFVLDQYREAVEKVTQNAKAEVDAFVGHTVTQLGFKSMEELAKNAQNQLQ